MTKKSSPQYRKFLSGILSFVVLVFLFSSGPAVALNEARSGLDQTAKCGFGNCGAGNVSDTGIMTSVPSAIGKVVGVVLSFVGALFMLLMIYSGILWMTARGNETQVSKAKDLIYAAIIGLVIVLAAYAITAFVGGQLTTNNS